MCRYYSSLCNNVASGVYFNNGHSYYFSCRFIPNLALCYVHTYAYCNVLISVHRCNNNDKYCHYNVTP